MELIDNLLNFKTALLSEAGNATYRIFACSLRIRRRERYYEVSIAKKNTVNSTAVNRRSYTILNLLVYVRAIRHDSVYNFDVFYRLLFSRIAM